MPFHLVQRITVPDSNTANPGTALEKFSVSDRELANTHFNVVKELANTHNIFIDKYVSNNILITSYSEFDTANDAVSFHQSMRDLPTGNQFRNLMRSKTANTTVQKYSVTVRQWPLANTYPRNKVDEFISAESNTIVQTIVNITYDA